MVTIRNTPTRVVSANAEDLPLVFQICVFMIVGGILLTFVGYLFYKPLTAIGVIMAFGAAGVFVFLIWRDVHKEMKEKEKNAAKVPSEPTESAKTQKTDGLCPHCGKFIGYDGAEFCTFCGNKILR